MDRGYSHFSKKKKSWKIKNSIEFLAFNPNLTFDALVFFPNLLQPKTAYDLAIVILSVGSPISKFYVVSLSSL